jgi:hypothetical protein
MIRMQPWQTNGPSGISLCKILQIGAQISPVLVLLGSAWVTGKIHNQAGKEQSTLMISVYTALPEAINSGNEKK